MPAHRSARRKVAVVGGGVVGLSCAMQIAEHEEQYEVCVIGESIGPLSDSRKATAIWHVYLVPETAQVLAWAQRSLEVFYAIAQDSPDAGVELVQGVELFRKGSPQVPSWSRIPRVFEMLTPEELASYNAIVPDGIAAAEMALLREHPVTWGYRIEAPAARMVAYLAWLEARVLNRGVQIRRMRLTTLNDLVPEFDVIVNCSGFGARELVGDRDFVAYKGQYFVLKGSEDSPRAYIGDDDHPSGMAYMIPLSGEVMVGGCAEKGIEDLEFTLDWTETIKRADIFVPWLRDRSPADQARSTVVGIRPCRTNGVRLEVDLFSLSVPVIHNYGHGGSGFSLSWGCAETVEALLRAAP